MSQDCISSLIPFHVISGCDATSYIAGHTKKKIWKIYQSHNNLLQGLGDGLLVTEEMLSSVEQFVCRVYGQEHTNSIDESRKILFPKTSNSESLPPTANALHLHTKRAHYQSYIWKNAHNADPELPVVTEMGWKRESGNLVPVLTTTELIPKNALECASCNCRTRCQTMRCKCRRLQLACISMCGCKIEDEDCFNA